MLLPLLRRYYRSVREGFPWKSHAELLPIVENGLSYSRKQTYTCETCGFTTRGLPRHEVVINSHLQEAIDCQTPLPPPSQVWPFVFMALQADGLGWTQAVYELAVLRRLMGCADLRRHTWEEAFYNPAVNQNLRPEPRHGARRNGQLRQYVLHHEEYAAMVLLAPLAEPMPMPPRAAPGLPVREDDTTGSWQPGAGNDVQEAPMPAADALPETCNTRTNGRFAVAAADHAARAFPIERRLPQSAPNCTSSSAQGGASVEVVSLDSTIEEETEQPVFSSAASARPVHPSVAGLLSRVVRRLEREGFPNHRIVNTLHKLPGDRLGSIDAFYIVDGAVVADAEPFKEEYACQICFNDKIAVMPNGCGDFKFCDKCLPAAGECPICRVPYTAKVVVRTEFLN